MSERIRILLAVRGSYLTQVLAGRIAAEPQLEVVASVGNLDALRGVLARVEPHVGVVDFGLLAPRALRVLRELRALRPAMPIILLVDDGAAEYRQAAAEAGAAVCIEKLAALPTLIDAIKGLRWSEPRMPV